MTWQLVSPRVNDPRETETESESIHPRQKPQCLPKPNLRSDIPSYITQTKTTQGSEFWKERSVSPGL